MNVLANALADQWTLSEMVQGEQRQNAIDLPARIFSVGRARDNDLVIDSAAVSEHHAEITWNDDHLAVSDLGSAGGTYINGNRVESGKVVAGDLIQFGEVRYQVGKFEKAVDDDAAIVSCLPWSESLIEFDTLISNRSITANFQRIINLADRQTIGFEMLARSSVQSLNRPSLMFAAAESLGQQGVLSEMLREIGMAAVDNSGIGRVRTFLNTHPLEFDTDRLVASLESLRRKFPDYPMTIEINEAAVTSTAKMNEFRQFLKTLDMQLAYDNFGMGQSRLLELAEAPADVLKFDMRFIRDVDAASQNRRQQLGDLVSIAKDSGSLALAQGVETEAEHEACCQLGFDLGQGFLYGRPGLLDQQ